MKRGPKVIVFSPVRQAPEVLKEALASHLALRGISDLWYVDDNDADSFSSLLLRGIGAKVFYAAGIERLPAREPYHIDDSKTHQWTGSLMARMAGLRDFAIQEFLKTDADFLFMIDSDVLPNPGLVEHLVSLDMPLVTEVYWSQWSPLEPCGQVDDLIPRIEDRVSKHERVLVTTCSETDGRGPSRHILKKRK